MRECFISTKGVAQSLKSAQAESSRLLLFPDGVTRHIVLPGWQWAIFDSSNSGRSKVTAADLIYLAFKQAKNDKRYPDWPFEAKIRYFFSVHLEVAISDHSRFARPQANE